MSSRRLRIIILLISVALASILLAPFFTNHRTVPTSKREGFYPQELGLKSPCPGKTETVIMSDPYLPGQIEVGQSVKVIWNWYACHPPQTGEIALVRIGRDLAPKAKVIRAVSGDKIALTQDASNERWNLLMNNQPILDFQNVKYAFGGKPLPPIGRYIQAHGSILGPKDVIVFSTRSPGEFDSGVFGVMGVDDLVAKIELE